MWSRMKPSNRNKLLAQGVPLFFLFIIGNSIKETMKACNFYSIWNSNQRLQKSTEPQTSTSKWYEQNDSSF